MTAKHEPAEVERVMEELVYEHLIDLVDFDRMFQLERILCAQLVRLAESGMLVCKTDPDSLIERVDAIVARAWHRILEDPRRHVDFKGEWAPDDDCEICKALAAQAPS